MMLPDGVHKREDDWTLFFLNRKSDLEAIVRIQIFFLQNTEKNIYIFYDKSSHYKNAT